MGKIKKAAQTLSHAVKMASVPDPAIQALSDLTIQVLSGFNEISSLVQSLKKKYEDYLTPKEDALFALQQALRKLDFDMGEVYSSARTLQDALPTISDIKDVRPEIDALRTSISHRQHGLLVRLEELYRDLLALDSRTKAGVTLADLHGKVLVIAEQLAKDAASAGAMVAHADND